MPACAPRLEGDRRRGGPGRQQRRRRPQFDGASGQTSSPSAPPGVAGSRSTTSLGRQARPGTPAGAKPVRPDVADPCPGPTAAGAASRRRRGAASALVPTRPSPAEASRHNLPAYGQHGSRVPAGRAIAGARQAWPAACVGGSEQYTSSGRSPDMIGGGPFLSAGRGYDDTRSSRTSPSRCSTGAGWTSPTGSGAAFRWHRDGYLSSNVASLSASEYHPRPALALPRGTGGAVDPDGPTRSAANRVADAPGPNTADRWQRPAFRRSQPA